MFCSIVQTPKDIQIDPSHNGGTRGDEKGFHYRVERRILVGLDDPPEHIGAALLRGFDACTSIYDEKTP
jgi:hypothetical protein